MSTIAQAVSRADHLEISLPKGLVIAGLVATLYGPLMTQMVVQWWQDPDYGHGFVVPLFVGYVLYQRRHKLQHVQLGPSCDAGCDRALARGDARRGIVRQSFLVTLSVGRDDPVFRRLENAARRGIPVGFSRADDSATRTHL